MAAAGRTPSIVQADVAGAEGLPAGSIAVTVKTCPPAASGPKPEGLVHAAAGDASSLQEKVEPASFEEKLKVAPVWLVRGGGPEAIDATGGVVSIVQANEAGAETLPAGSLAVTVSVWLPAAIAP